jgi:hypothetical protein
LALRAQPLLGRALAILELVTSNAANAPNNAATGAVRTTETGSVTVAIGAEKTANSRGVRYNMTFVNATVLSAKLTRTTANNAVMEAIANFSLLGCILLASSSTPSEQPSYPAAELHERCDLDARQLQHLLVKRLRNSYNSLS